MTPLDPARDYQFRGWALVPVPARSKRPTVKDWPNYQFGIADLDPEGNVALRLGQRSGNLVDIDLDCREALELADLYLPPTGAEFGRASKPRSHRLYISAGATFEVFHDPLTDKKNTLLELRADGRDGGAHITLAPPSIADGERREWHGETVEPAKVDARALRQRVAWLAVGCLVMRWGARPLHEALDPICHASCGNGIRTSPDRRTAGSASQLRTRRNAARDARASKIGETLIWPRLSPQSPMIAAGRAGTISALPSMPPRATAGMALSSSTTSAQDHRVTTRTRPLRAGAITRNTRRIGPA